MNAVCDTRVGGLTEDEEKRAAQILKQLQGLTIHDARFLLTKCSEVLDTLTISGS